MPDKFPPSYYDARKKCSLGLLGFFDRQLESHAHYDLMPTDTPQGMLYLFTSIAFAGIPQLFLWGSNSINYSIRHRLYDNLVQIAQDERRLKLGNTSACLDALNSILVFQDLAECPLEMLDILLLADFQKYLASDLMDIQWKKNKMAMEIHKAETESQKGELRREIDSLLTMMEQLRGANYSKAQMQLIINKVRGNKLNELWQDLLSSKIQILKVHHQDMEQYTLAEKEIFSKINELIEILTSANETYLKKYKLAKSPQEKLLAAQSLLKICDEEIKTVKSDLKKEKHSVLLSLLENILNAAFAIVTLGMSYALTHRFRLFSFNNQNIPRANHLVKLAEEQMHQSSIEMVDLHERESQVTLS